MQLRSLLPIIVLMSQSALTGQDTGVLMKKGDAALASGLWEMAALHFEQCLTSRTLSAADKPGVAIRLAESWTRGGKAKEALELLSQSWVSQHPEVSFWKGQALLGLGRFADAVAALSPLLEEPGSPFRSEAAFTLANLQVALGHPDDALAALSSLSDITDPALAAKARLHQVEIFLDLGRPVEARAVMPPTESISPADRTLATFLEAHLQLSEGRPDEAASGFQSLIDQPQGQSLQRYHRAALGLADAITARGNPDAALAFLVSFIQENPESPELDAMFRRLLDGLPEKPSPTDPLLERIEQWITPAELPATGLLGSSDSNAEAAWPVTITTSDLLAHSLFTRAMGLHRIGTPEARAEARRLFNRLRVENPGHVLTHRALFQMARWALDDGANERAIAILDALRETSSSAKLQGESAFLEARTAFLAGDKDKAIRLFDEAASLLAADESKRALFNAAVIRFSNGSTTVAQPLPKGDDTLTADLEIERALANNKPDAKRAAIEEFLTQHPDHPRAPEARLAAAEAALIGPSPDLSFAKAQLETLAADPEKSASLSPSRIALTRLRVEDLAKDHPAAIASARSILEKHPGEPAANEAALILGRNHFQTGSYNEALLVFKNLAAADTDPARAEAAWLLAARSATLVRTSQSQQEALTLFDQVIDAKGPVSSLAKLEKARLLIDMNRLPEAITFLRKWFGSLDEKDPLHLPAGFLLAEAIRGSGSPEALTEALAVYDKLLSHAKDQPAIFNRIQYNRGITLEQIPDEKDPSGKRQREAFIAYYSVLETPEPPPEWHYFELCGFNALKLLGDAGRWPAAIACAKKIASFNGPRAKEAADLAAELQLKHMIWED
jgi:outer membrane protein assembly factor BamD (BamD/ComL family)